MQKYKEINGNDYVKDSRTTINETMQSIQSMNSGTAFPTNNLFEGMKCYRTDLKKTYTLTDVENNTWVEDAHATLSDEATHAASATKLQTARSLNLGGAVTADAATFDGTANATINVKTLDATKLKGTASVSTTGNAATATKVVTTAATGASANIAEASMGGSDSARIRVSGDTNAGELALETADDGDEAIVARQYTGAYTKVARTASILDKNGNTSFPGTVVAPNFTGALSGNAATATKLQTPRTLSLTGKAAGSATFDGSANAAINVTSVNADTASKLSTARKINITGNATGATTFDGTSDVSINVSVSQAAHADKATADANGNELANAQRYVHVYDLPNNTDFNNVKTTGIYTCTQDSYTNRPVGSWGVLRVYWFSDNVKQEYVPDNRYEVYERYFTGGTWNAWSKVNAGNADTATTANAINNLGDKTAIKDGTKEPAGLNLYKVYSNGYPVLYGNLLSIGGAGGGELLAEWSGSDKGVGHLYYRNRRDAGNLWSDWRTVAFTSDINSFAPTKTGGGASGTWGISISGNADTATTADTLKETLDRPASANVTYNDGKIRYFLATNSMSEGKPPGGDGPVIHLSWDRPLWESQITINNPSGHIQTRAQDNGTWGSWKTVLDSDNFNNYAPTKTGGGASGTWGINISGNAASATNADTVDGIHAASMFYNKGDWASDNWATIGTYQVNGNPPVSDAYGWGQVISSSTNDGRFQLYASHQGSNGRLRYRTGWDNDKSQPWNTILDSENYNLFSPTKTGGGASGTWGINISGNAASATNADKVDGYHASDIINRISAANTGGIVAASLTENGYVKFANGLILQWGSNTGGGPWHHFTFPIAFSNVFEIIGGYSTTSTGQIYGAINNITNTGFDMSIAKLDTGRYIAIGI